MFSRSPCDTHSHSSYMRAFCIVYWTTSRARSPERSCEVRRRQSNKSCTHAILFLECSLAHAGSLKAGAWRFWLQRPQRCRSKGSWNLANGQRNVSINSCLPVLHHDPECDWRQPNASRAFAQSGLCGTSLTYRDILQVFMPAHSARPVCFCVEMSLSSLASPSQS